MVRKVPSQLRTVDTPACGRCFGTNGKRPAPAAEWGLSDVPWPAGPTEL